MDKKNLINGIIYVIKHKDKLLLTKRIKQGSYYYGQYVFPAGRLEECDASTNDTLVREVKEERGCEVLDSTPLGVISYNHPSGSRIALEVFIVDKSDIRGQVKNLEPEKEELHWVTISEASRLCVQDGPRLVLKLLEENLFN